MRRAALVAVLATLAFVPAAQAKRVTVATAHRAVAAYATTANYDLERCLRVNRAKMHCRVTEYDVCPVYDSGAECSPDLSARYTVIVRWHKRLTVSSTLWADTMYRANGRWHYADDPT